MSDELEALDGVGSSQKLANEIRTGRWVGLGVRDAEDAGCISGFDAGGDGGTESTASSVRGTSCPVGIQRRGICGGSNEAGEKN